MEGGEGESESESRTGPGRWDENRKLQNETGDESRG